MLKFLVVLCIILIVLCTGFAGAYAFFHLKELRIQPQYAKIEAGLKAIAAQRCDTTARVMIVNETKMFGGQFCRVRAFVWCSEKTMWDHDANASFIRINDAWVFVTAKKRPWLIGLGKWIFRM